MLALLVKEMGSRGRVKVSALHVLPSHLDHTSAVLPDPGLDMASPRLGGFSWDQAPVFASVRNLI